MSKYSCILDLYHAYELLLAAFEQMFLLLHQLLALPFPIEEVFSMFSETIDEFISNVSRHTMAGLEMLDIKEKKEL